MNMLSAVSFPKQIAFELGVNLSIIILCATVVVFVGSGKIYLYLSKVDPTPPTTSRNVLFGFILYHVARSCDCEEPE